jgi:hypothetical protein
LIFTKTGTALPVRILTPENHCEKLAFTTGADRHLGIFRNTVVNDPGDRRKSAPRQWQALFCILF